MSLLKNSLLFVNAKIYSILAILLNHLLDFTIYLKYFYNLIKLNLLYK